MGKELEVLIRELEEYENKYGKEYLEFFKDRGDKTLEFNIDGKKKFLKVIQELKKIKPIEEYENIKKINYEGELLDNLDIGYIKLFIVIKKSIVKGEWFDVINNFLNLAKQYNILQEKLYYSIINII
ncbi:MAG: hypothetical protein SPH93_02470 [Clostridium sp.]|uniref:hypothetical protein n=1 Tax=Clostridium sp. TaxID=1506 RepID=UPI002A913B75|nr:hypothetical protein [Clostridium sp.]MDY6226535.1 hypothetical protein [Clostridium sp.]